MSLNPEPTRNPNGRFMTDPPVLLRYAMKKMIDKVIDPSSRTAKRNQAESTRLKNKSPHTVEYFHQSDDPYSQLAMQVLGTLVERYDIDLVTHQIRASGGKNQPELEKLVEWSKRDADLIAPHYGLLKPRDCEDLNPVSSEMLDQGSKRLFELGHYSGAMFYYAGEWYWGVDRLFYLEQRLRDLGVCRDENLPFICPRPEVTVEGVDASKLTLDFYPSLNSPYTSIIYDKTIKLAHQCKIQLKHKPVLPMIMRGVPATREKGIYIMFDTKREAEYLGVGFGPVMTPIGEPTRRIYSLLPWARRQGRDTQLLSAALDLAFRKGVSLHNTKGIKKAVEQANLDWSQARMHLGDQEWKAETANNQIEMSEELGLWGVPSYCLRGASVKEDFFVWGQDRLWLIAKEIVKRARKIESRA
jgi:2-hydroxychromene-2-carboxylate isomerase